MELVRRYMAGFITFVVVGVLLGTFFLGYSSGYDDSRNKPPERILVHDGWTLPARFNDQGAFTIGCHRWDVPFIVPYDEHNQNTGYFALSVDGQDLLAVVDGPGGTVMLSGENCGGSTDFSAFPIERRPVPEDLQTSTPAGRY